jgi:predicted permease
MDHLPLRTRHMPVGPWPFEAFKLVKWVKFEVWKTMKNHGFLFGTWSMLYRIYTSWSFHSSWRISMALYPSRTMKNDENVSSVLLKAGHGKISRESQIYHLKQETNNIIILYTVEFLESITPMETGKLVKNPPVARLLRGSSWSLAHRAMLHPPLSWASQGCDDVDSRDLRWLNQNHVESHLLL